MVRSSSNYLSQICLKKKSIQELNQKMNEKTKCAFVSKTHQEELKTYESQVNQVKYLKKLQQRIRDQ